MDGLSRGFAGSVPQLYERYMVPLMFDVYAADLAEGGFEHAPDVVTLTALVEIVTAQLDALRAQASQLEGAIANLEAALPLDPGSAPAQAFYDEWQQLLAPFTAVASPQMMEGASRVWSGMDQWSGKEGMPQAPFSKQVWEFVRAAGQARKDRESA